MEDVLTLSPGNGVPYYLVLVVIGAVNAVRLLLYRSKKPWTNKIGGKWTWIGLAAFFSIAICVGFQINVIKDLANIESIGSLKLTGTVGYIASGIALSLSSNLGTWIASLPHNQYIGDLKEGNPVPGSEETPIVTPIVTPVSHTEIPPIQEAPRQHTYRTSLLNTWTPFEAPEYVLIERDDGKKSVLKVTSEEETVDESILKITSL